MQEDPSGPPEEIPQPEAGLTEVSAVSIMEELPEGFPSEGFKPNAAFPAEETQNGGRDGPTSFAFTKSGFAWGPMLLTRRISHKKDGWALLEIMTQAATLQVKVLRGGQIQCWLNGKVLFPKPPKQIDAWVEYYQKQFLSLEAGLKALGLEATPGEEPVDTALRVLRGTPPGTPAEKSVAQ